jgi:hypothetical protein
MGRVVAKNRRYRKHCSHPRRAQNAKRSNRNNTTVTTPVGVTIVGAPEMTMSHIMVAAVVAALGATLVAVFFGPRAK